MDANVNIFGAGSKKVLLPGLRGSISDDITLENEHGNVVVKDIRKDNTVLRNLGLSKGDELVGATIFFDNMNKNDVMDILKATEPYKTGIQLHVKNDAKSPDMTFSSPSFNLSSNDMGSRDHVYESLFNNKIKRHLKAAKSLENLYEASNKRANRMPILQFAGKQSASLERPTLDIQGGDFKTVKTPTVDIEAPKVNWNGPEIKANSPDFKMPGFGTSVGVPELNGNMKAPSLDMSRPKVEGNFRAPDAKVDLPSVDVKGPEFKMPSMDMFSAKAGGPDGDFNVQGPQMKGGVNIPSTKLKGNIDGMDLDINAPNITLKGQEQNMNAPHFKMPSFGMAGPNVKGPELDGNLKVPSLDVSVPKVKGDFKAPAAKVDLPSVDVKGPNFNMPSFGMFSTKAGVPDVDLNIKGPEIKGDVNIPSPKLKTNIEGPDIGINAPNISLKNSENKISVPQFKMPSFGMSGSSIKSPELDANIKTPSLDASLPKVEGELKAPTAKVDLPNVDAKSSKFKMPSFGLSGPGINAPKLDGNLKTPSLDVSLPKVEGELKAPTAKVDLPNVDTKSPKFKMPSFGFSGPSIKGPVLDANLKTPSLDVSLPKVEGELKAPTAKVDLPNVDAKSSKFKMPSFGLSGPGIKAPELDGNLKTPSLDVSLPKVEGELKAPTAKVDLPNVDAKSPKFKMPSFGISGPSIQAPELDGNLKTPSLDVSLPKVEGELKAPTAKVDLPNVDAKSSKFKMPSFGLSGPGIKAPELDGNLKTPSLDVSLPKVEGELKAPTAKVDLPNVDTKSPKFKMPSFGFSGPSIKGPELDANLKTPSLDVSLPKVEGELKAPTAKVDLPNVNTKSSKFKMPSFGFSGPSIKGPELDANLKTPSLDVSLPKVEGELKAPTAKVDLPNVDAKSSKFKMPSFGLSGPSIKAPELDGNLKTPSLDVSLPKVEGELKAPTAKVDLPNVDTKGPKFQMPSFNSRPGFPDVDLKIKSPQVKGNIDIPSPKLNTNMEVPDMDLKVPNVSLKDSENKINLPHLKMPSFGISGPSLKTPEIEVDGKIKKPDVDISVPNMKGKFKSPEVGIDLPNVDIKAPNIQMPSINMPSGNLSLPEGGASMSGPELKGDLNIKNPKLKGDLDIGVPNLNVKKTEKKSSPHFKMPSFKMSMPTMKSPDLDVSLPNVEGGVKAPSAKIDVPNVDAKGPRFKMPSLKMFHAKPGIPDADLSLKSPKLKGEIDVPTSKLQGDLKSSSLDYRAPDVNLKSSPKSMTLSPKLKGPDINLDLPAAEVKGPKFKMPSFGISGPNIKSPELDGNLKSPSLDVSLPKVEGDFKAPVANVDLPHVDTKKTKFKMPSFGLSGPSVKAPELDGNIKTPSLDMSLPKVEGDFKAPGAKVDLPNVDAKSPKFKMPSFDMFNAKGAVPDVDLNVKAPALQGNIDIIPSTKLKTNIEGPHLDISAPDINVKGPDNKMKLPHFKMPSFGMPGPSLTTSEIEVDGKMKGPDVDVSVPKVKNTFKGPELGVNLPDASIIAPKINMPSIDMPSGNLSLPKGGLNVNAPELKGDLNIINPKLKGDFKVPDLDVKTPNIDVKGSDHNISLPHFKMPSLGLSGGSVKAPDLDGNIKTSSVDVSLPNVEGDFKGPTSKVDLPNVDAKGSKFKMPSFGMFNTKTSDPDVDLNVKSPELKGDLNIKNPKFKGDLKVPDLDIKAPNIDMKDSDKKLSSPHFKMPSFGLSGPSIKTPDQDGNIKTPSLDVSLPKVEGDFKAPGAKVDLPNVDVKSPKFKMPSFDMFNAKVGVPDVDVNLKAPNAQGHIDIPGKMKVPDLDVSVPKVKGNFKTLDGGVNLPDADITGPKIKMPSINLTSGNVSLPEGGLTVNAPELKGGLNNKTPNLKGDIKVPNLNVTAPDINIKGSDKKASSPHFKMPSFGLSGASVKAPELDGNIKSPSLDVSLPNVEGDFKVPSAKVDLPNVDAKSPKIKMPSFGMFNTKTSFPDVDLSFKAPDLKQNIDVKAPNIKGPSVDVSGPKIDSTDLGIEGKIKKPDIGVSVPKLKNPEINMDLPKADIKPSKFKMPKFFQKKQVPAADLSLKTPQLSADVSGPKLKSTVQGPELDMDAPNINVSKSEKKSNSFNFKLPGFGNSGPNVNSPDLEVGGKVNERGIDVEMPETKGTFKGPDIKVDLPDANIKDPKMKMPSLNISGDNYTAPDGHVNVKTPTLKGNANITSPNVDIDDPNITLNQIKPSTNFLKFKVPKADFDVSLPTVEGKLESPVANANLPNVDARGKHIDMALPNISQTKGVPGIHLNMDAPDISGNSEFHIPKLKANAEVPDVDVEEPSFSLKRSQKNMNLPQFSMPSIEMPKVKIGGKMNTPFVDASLPNVKNSLRGPEVNAELPDVDIAVPKMKSPSVSISPGRPQKKILVPDIDLNLEAPEVKGKVDLSAPELDVNSQKENAKHSEKKISGPEFKFPSLGFSGPRVKTPELKPDINIKSENIGISVPKVEGNFKSPTMNMDLPKVGVRDASLKMPSVQDVHIESNLPNSKLKLDPSNLECDTDVNVNGPEAKVKAPEKQESFPWFKGPLFGKSKFSMKTPEIDVTDKTTTPKLESSPQKMTKSLQSEIGGKKPDVANDNYTSRSKTGIAPSGKADIDLQGAKLNIPDLKGPDVEINAQLKTPEVGFTRVENESKLPMTGIDINSPKEDQSFSSQNRKAKGSSHKFPFDLSDSSFSLPELDFGFSAPKLSTT
ncbi:neuroblast differentiation-associated protein AHNAK-like [Ambystoma mexicanum]|uniref:neuroblast differentiation-associated protein AHNAK-like n=1 Tax=Ambystoma mexicanum TaxID=8296 RepID=UPI0037E98D98